MFRTPLRGAVLLGDLLEEESRVARDVEGDTRLLGVHGLIEGFDLAARGAAGAAELGGVGVEDDLEDAVVAAHLVADAVDLREVQDAVQLLAVLVFPLVGQHRVRVVVGDDPLEAFPAVVDLPQGRCFLIEGVEGPRVPEKPISPPGYTILLQQPELRHLLSFPE